MTSKNPITGDRLVTKPATDDYRENWERIFDNKYKADKDKEATYELPMFLRKQAS